MLWLCGLIQNLTTNLGALKNRVASDRLLASPLRCSLVRSALLARSLHRPKESNSSLPKGWLGYSRSCTQVGEAGNEILNGRKTVTAPPSSPRSPMCCAPASPKSFHRRAIEWTRAAQKCPPLVSQQLCLHVYQQSRACLVFLFLSIFLLCLSTSSFPAIPYFKSMRMQTHPALLTPQSNSERPLPLSSASAAVQSAQPAAYCSTLLV